MRIKDEYERIGKKLLPLLSNEDIVITRMYSNIWHNNTSNLCDKSVIIYGAGANTDYLFSLLISWRETKKIAYIVDGYTKKKQLYGVPIVRQINENDIGEKKIWISSFRYRNEMKDVVTSKGGEYIDPYEILGSIIAGAEEKDICERVGGMRYIWFNKQINRRKRSNDLVEKEKVSKMLIAGYYYIADWSSLINEIEMYLSSDYSDKKLISELYVDIKGLFELIKKKISNLETDHTFIIVVDAMSKYICNKMPRLSELKKQAVEFTNYRCECSGTIESLDSVLTGWEAFENTTYPGRDIHHNDSLFLEELNRENVGFKCISDDRNVMWSYREINEYNDTFNEIPILSEVLFNGLCELSEANRKSIVLAHSGVTVHYPHYSPFNKFIESDEGEVSLQLYKENFDEAVIYTDTVLTFYIEMLSCNRKITQVVMGDHGLDLELEFYSMISKKRTMDNGMKWNGKTYDTGLIIKSQYMKPGVCDELISNIQFVEILRAINEGNDPRDVLELNRVIPIECVPGWDASYISRGLKSGNYYFGIGASGCMNKEFVYINTEEDEEFYFRIEGEKYVRLRNSSDIVKAEESIGKTEIMKHRFPKELLQEEFFTEHNKLYRKYSGASKNCSSRRDFG